MRRVGIALIIMLVAGSAQANMMYPKVTIEPGTVPTAGYSHSDLLSYAYASVSEMNPDDAESIRSAVTDTAAHANGDAQTIAIGLSQASNLSTLVRRAASYGLGSNESHMGVRTNLSLARGASGLGEGTIALLTELGRPPSELEAVQLRQQAATVPPTLAKTASLMIFAVIDARHYVDRALVGVTEADRALVDANLLTLSTIHRRMEFAPVEGGFNLEFSEFDQDVIDAAVRIGAAINQTALVQASDVLVQAVDEISTMTLPVLPPGSWPSDCGTGTFYFATDDCEVILGDGGPNQYQRFQQPGGNLDDINVVLIDFGGNDKYTHRAGGGTRGNRVQVNLDFAGNDIYERSTNVGAAHGAGVDGVGLLYDRAGSDQYFVRNSWSTTVNHLTQGAGERGIGMLLDMADNDVYTTEYWGSAGGHYGVAQGAGLISGMGLLLDKTGSDSYTYAVLTAAGREWTDGGAAQAFGSQGAGLLIDLGEQGDAYSAGQDMVQSAASLGGFAFLMDGGGQNSFHTQSFKGCTRMDGVDCLSVHPQTYEWIAGWSQAYADTNGIAFLYVGRGPDQYSFQQGGTTVGPAEGVNLQGVGNTSGVAIFLDLGGADTYSARAFSQAYASAGVAVFTDVGGDDIYGCFDITCIGYATEGGIAVWCDRTSTSNTFADGDPRSIPFARGNVGIGARDIC